MILDALAHPWRAAVVATVVTAIGITAGLYAAKLVKPLYMVRAAVLIDRDDPTTGAFATQISGAGDSVRRTLIFNKLAVWESDLTAGLIVDGLQSSGDDYPDLTKQIEQGVCRGEVGDDLRRCVARFLRAELKTDVHRNADVVQMALSTPYPDEGQKLMALALTTWMNENRRLNAERRNEIFKVLEQRLKEAEKLHAARQQAIETFLSQYPLLASSQLTETVIKASRELDGEIRALEAEKMALGLSISDVASADRLLEQTGGSLTPRQEEVLREKAFALYSRSLDEVPLVVKETEKVNKQLELLYKERHRADRQLKSLPDLLSQYKILTLNYELQSNLLMKLKEQVTALQVGRLSERSGLTVVSPPTRDPKPYFPRRSVMGALGGGLGFLLIGLLVLTSSAPSDSLRERTPSAHSSSVLPARVQVSGSLFAR